MPKKLFNITQDNKLVYQYETEVKVSNLPGNNHGPTMLLQPVVTIKSNEAVEPKHIVFILDRSGSMQSEMANLKQAAKGLCNMHITPQDKVSVITFDDTANLLVNKASKAEALTAINTIQAAGGTNFVPALEKIHALSNLVPHNTLIVFLTDGQACDDINKAKQVITILHQNIGKLNWLFLGLGNGYDHQKLNALAKEADGKVLHIPNASQITPVVNEVSTLFSSRIPVNFTLANDTKQHADSKAAVPGLECFGATIFLPQSEKVSFSVQIGEHKKEKLKLTIDLSQLSYDDDLIYNYVGSRFQALVSAGITEQTKYNDLLEYMNYKTTSPKIIGLRKDIQEYLHSKDSTRQKEILHTVGMHVDQGPKTFIPPKAQTPSSTPKPPVAQTIPQNVDSGPATFIPPKNNSVQTPQTQTTTTTPHPIVYPQVPSAPAAYIPQNAFFAPQQIIGVDTYTPTAPALPIAELAQLQNNYGIVTKIPLRELNSLINKCNNATDARAMFKTITDALMAECCNLTSNDPINRHTHLVSFFTTVNDLLKDNYARLDGKASSIYGWSVSDELFTLYKSLRESCFGLLKGYEKKTDTTENKHLVLSVASNMHLFTKHLGWKYEGGPGRSAAAAEIDNLLKKYQPQSSFAAAFQS